MAGQIVVFIALVVVGWYLAEVGKLTLRWLRKKAG